MKISIPMTSSWDAVSETHTIVGSDIRFSRKSPTSYQALVPLKLPNSGAAGDTRTFITTVPISITAERAVTSKNRTRVLLKVAMPYTAIQPDVANDAVVANQFDSRRSGGELAFHVVFSGPAAFAADLRGDMGSTCQRAAIAQKGLLERLLGVLTGRSTTALVGCLGNNASGSALFELGPVGLWDKRDDDVASGKQGDILVSKDTAASFSAMPDTDFIPPLSTFSSNGLTGLDVSAMGATLNYNEPLTRGLMNTDPLHEDTVLTGFATRGSM